MVNIVSLKSLYVFKEEHPEFADAINAWVAVVRVAKWQKPQDIVDEFGERAIDLLGKKDNKPTTVSCERVVFDLRGNHIRIIAKYKFHPKLSEPHLYIKWIGIHRDYTKLCKQNLQYEVTMFK